MLDFLIVSKEIDPKSGELTISPIFCIKGTKDLMIRGSDFYAIWIESRGMWSTDEQDVIELIDKELKNEQDKYAQNFEKPIHTKCLWNSSTGSIDRWHKYCQKQMRDTYVPLDETIIFANDETSKDSYATHKLPYSLEETPIHNYEQLMNTLYAEEERQKIEWAIGAIVSGDSRYIQKFMVFYGEAGSGKSTVLNIIQQLFEGYTSVFDARALGSSSNSFALEAFKNNPLVAIQHDGDLSHIEDNTRLNSLVSHEAMVVNEKFKSTYEAHFNAFLFMGTNKPVKITDAKSGLIRRLLDVVPSGNKLRARDYRKVVHGIQFELGGIAKHCLDYYTANKEAYDSYIPINMLGASNDFYNFVLENYFIFKKDDHVTLQIAWKMYQAYCDEASVPYPLSKRVIKEELKNYFDEYKERVNKTEGDLGRARNVYSGFRTWKFTKAFGGEDDGENSEEPTTPLRQTILEFKEQPSIFDKVCANCPAQLAKEVDGTPSTAWDNVKKTLKDIDTSSLHYVRVPENHIVIDFDIPGPDGEKNFDLNLKEASKWPETYAELSKSGAGIHLHYIYTGDASQLSRIYDDKIEVKVFTGKSSLRRKLTKCNDKPIATISSGLPLKGADKVINFEVIKSEKRLRSLIKRNLEKEVHPYTKPSIDFIKKILDDAYTSGLHYDVSDVRNSILGFAAGSTHQSAACIKAVNEMKFKSEEPSNAAIDNANSKRVFFDIEVYPNLFLVVWKMAGDDKACAKMFNPTPEDIEGLVRHKLIGFNNRKYDNHLLYARMIGYDNAQLYHLSQRIVNSGKQNDRDCFFGEAYNLSYTDVYDFCSTKQSLKKWEIALGIHHQEMGIPWDEPVPESKWVEVAKYCENDVLATEAVFNSQYEDFEAREILADITGGKVNDTTNQLTKQLIFGKEQNPQSEFVYTDLSKDFPGYKYEFGKSTYRGEEVGEGGYVYSEPGIYKNIALLDIASMHPHSAIALNIFGDKYTARFAELVNARIAVKHKDSAVLSSIFGGALKQYVGCSDKVAKNLAKALKIAINSVYGLTAAKFPNAFRDIRNKDNIIAKRGALFMVNLKHEVQQRGFTVAHIKTDSIKIPDATPDIIKFVQEYGKKWGYSFEHEATYSKMCLVNDAVYIAKESMGEDAGKWTATGTQFQVPYVFKTLFSKEPIEFKDMCETKSATTSLYLDFNENLQDVTPYEKEMANREYNAKHAEDDKKSKRLNPQFEKFSNGDILTEIAKGHSYSFVGKVGSFCPIKPGFNAGLLLREKEGKYHAVTGSKAKNGTPYRWLESEMVKNMGFEDRIDRSYYTALVDEAVSAIGKYGDFEMFVNE